MHRRVDPIAQDLGALHRQAIRHRPHIVVTQPCPHCLQQIGRGRAVSLQAQHGHHHHCRCWAFGGGIGDQTRGITRMQDVAVTRPRRGQPFIDQLNAFAQGLVVL
ncbi:hypothetical protein D3C77_542080 [compost metagenome]